MKRMADLAGVATVYALKAVNGSFTPGMQLHLDLSKNPSLLAPSGAAVALTERRNGPPGEAGGNLLWWRARVRSRAGGPAGISFIMR